MNTWYKQPIELFRNLSAIFEHKKNVLGRELLIGEKPVLFFMFTDTFDLELLNLRSGEGDEEHYLDSPHYCQIGAYIKEDTNVIKRFALGQETWNYPNCRLDFQSMIAAADFLQLPYKLVTASKKEFNDFFRENTIYNKDINSEFSDGYIIDPTLKNKPLLLPIEEILDICTHSTRAENLLREIRLEHLF